MANHITAEEIVTLGKGRVALLADDCISFLTGPLRTRALNTDLLNRFNPHKHSEEAREEIGALVIGVLRNRRPPTVMSQEGATCFADIVIAQAGLGTADVNGTTMQAVGHLIAAVHAARSNHSTAIANLLNPDIVSDLNTGLEEKRKAKLRDTYPNELNAFMNGTAVPSVGEKHCCRLILADCLAPAAAMYLTGHLFDRRERMSCPEAREVLLRTELGIQIQDAVDQGRSIKEHQV